VLAEHSLAWRCPHILLVIPLNGKAAVQGAGPVDGGSVGVSDGIDEVLGIGVV
jgi:hypothetical protein